jgi:hypothetical protein
MAHTTDGRSNPLANYSNTGGDKVMTRLSEPVLFPAPVLIRLFLTHKICINFITGQFYTL